MTSEEQVVALLLHEWDEGLRITTVPQAMARLRLPDDEETRLRIARRVARAWRRRLGLSSLWHGLGWLRQADWRRPQSVLSALGRLPSLAAEARRWNPAVYILSNDEKLIARHILRHGQLHALDTISADLQLDRRTVDRGMRMLARIGFLETAGDSWALARGHERFLEGLGFNFHTVTVESGEQFNVP